MARETASAIPVTIVLSKEWPGASKKISAEALRWANAQGFKADAASVCLIPGKNGALEQVLVGANAINVWTLGDLPTQLPLGTYRLSDSHAKHANELMLGWLLGSYRFTRYKKPKKALPQLVPPQKANVADTNAMAEALNHARDLINTPANDMGPEELASEAKRIAQKYKAQYSEIVGEALLKANYPAVYEVGKASSRAPRLIDIRWGSKTAPKITLVGKGVCFDTGGLDIKPSSGMKLMKKDMGGAACVLALAQLIMQSKLNVRLRVLIPAVENSISGNAYRPFDVINTRKGITVEVGNTDAEGRLILCDALHEADQEKPDLILDFATLTGAARVAVGTEIAAFFTPDDKLANDLADHSVNEQDPMWRLPLWTGYRDLLNSQTATINSAPDGGYAGAITAALYLKEFVEHTKRWAHIDLMAWNVGKRPGRPVGAEAMAVRAVFAYLQSHYG